jgi:hypothetical protein
MMFRVGNGNQVEVPPIDRNTGAPMSYDNWRRYIAEYVEMIQSQLGQYEIVHNAIWFGGPAGVRDRDQYVLRQINAADYINCERGVSDGGLTGGTGIWSLRELFAYIDRVHARGKAVIMDEYYPPNLEYSLGSYFLISRDRDMIGDLATTPDNWWPGYDVELGTPLGERYDWQGLIRRDFSGGIVLVNEPDAPTRTVTLPGSYRTVTNQTVTSVTLAAKTGRVLRTVSGAVAPPPVGEGTYYVGDLTWKSATNGFGPAERNMSNGERGTADGRTIRIGGASYPKGLGVHANSDVRFNIGGNCSTFRSFIGIDDEVNGYGSVVFQVYADGVKIYESPVMTGGSANREVNVSVAGKNELRLVVDEAGDNIHSDHADWANARLACPTAPPAAALRVSYLSDRPWLFGTNGFGPVELDRSNGNFPPGDGRPITLNGVSYAKGLGVHAPAEIRYNLSGNCSTLEAIVGVDDDVGSYGSIVFEVWADSIKIFDSGLMYGDSPSQTVNVDLTGKNELRLVVLDGGNGIESDHGDWADAKLTCAD